MSNYRILAGAASILMTAGTAMADSVPEWQTIEAMRVGQLPAHALVVPYANGPQAREAILDQQYAKSPFYMDLNGQWSFTWSENPGLRPKGFQAPDYDVTSWETITVPGDWQSQGYGTKLYVNTTYEFDSDFYNFKKDAPRVPYEHNEVGAYRRDFTVPASWDGRRVVLAVEGGRSFFYAWVNGHLLGCNQDSKDAAEWDITPYLNRGQANTVALEVYRWSAGSYFECQDFWRLSGLERDVYLYSTPQTYVADFTVRSPLDTQNYRDGLLTVDLDLQGLPAAKAPAKKGRKAPAAKPWTVAYNLYDADGATVSTGTAVAAAAVQFTDTLTAAKAWSPEHPNLYTLELTLTDPAGAVTETLGCNVGFKTSEVKDGLWLLNGKRVIVKGANRHSWDLKGGPTVSPETAEKDMQLLKQNNFNTVRNSHYPADRLWYHLADKYGIMLIDEANVESHGYGYGDESLAKRPEWIPAVKDRVERMYAKSKNHPSVTFYSLGNESGNGVVFETVYDWFKAMNPMRPVQWERALDDYNSDIYANMYREPEFVKNYASNPASRPYILCEYAHAMGNSVGGLQDYMDLFETVPKAQGGCIWDWVDQSWQETTPDGTLYYTYGGDYGPAGIPSDNSFCCNGLVNSDRTQHPHLAEAKAQYRYIKSQLADTAALGLDVTNWYDFTDLEDYNLGWTVTNPQGDVITSGSKVVKAAPHQTVRVNLASVTLPAGTLEAFLDLSWTARKASPKVPKGFEVAHEQFVLPGNPQPQPAPAPVKLKKSKDGLYSAGAMAFTVDPATGALTSLGRDGANILATPLTVSLWRPNTENDERGWTQGGRWRKEGLDAMTQTAISKPVVDKNVVRVNVALTGKDGQNLGVAELSYSLTPGDNFRMGVTYLPDTATVRSLPRVGITYRTPEALIPEFTYLGRGPVENYADRHAGAFIGHYTTTPAANYHPYIVPQESGHHMDTRSLTVGDGLMTITPVGMPTFEFNVYPYTDQILQQARHISDLSRDGMVTVHLDAAHTGVGTATCGPDIYKHYLLDPQKAYTFGFDFQF